MTFIIAGKLRESTFLMADCITTNSIDNKKTFSDKLTKLDSSENEYYSFTGVKFVDYCLRTYDYWLSLNNRKNDFSNGTKSIGELGIVIKKNIESYSGKNQMQLKTNRFFFINKSSVVFYDLEFNTQNELIRCDKETLSLDFIVDSVINFPPEKNQITNETHIIDYCKKHLTEISKSDVDFKDRFSFIQLFENGNSTIQQPIKSYSDLIAVYNEIDFDLIDNEDFKWNI